jgi:hypothetical protein
MDKVSFTVEQVKTALLAIADEMTDSQMSMLRTHYLHRVASMDTIAQFGDYHSFHSANSQYGTLARKIADQLGFVSPGDQTYTIATLAERDKKGRPQWRLDDVVAKALEEIKWATPPDDGAALEDSSIDLSGVTETERRALIKARKGQGIFRSEVIALWGSCAVTGCSLERVLLASHIVPWALATNAERLDPFNGLLLTPNLDKLVDRLLISLNDDGSILVSKDLGAEPRAILGLGEQSKLRFVRPAMVPYLQRHRRLFLESHK